MALSGGEYERAEKLFEQAVDLFETAGNTHAAARASSLLGVTESTLGRIEQAIQRMEDAYSLIGEDEPDADLVILILRLGGLHYFAGNPERAAELTERGLDLAEALELPDQLGPRLERRRRLLTGLRRPEEARGLFQLALDTALAHELYPIARRLLHEPLRPRLSPRSLCGVARPPRAGARDGSAYRRTAPASGSPSAR